MGRSKADVDTDALVDLLQRGHTKDEMSELLGVSKPTLSARIADLTEKQGLLLKYRELQNLQLTELQARVLEAITPEKIADASLNELMQAFRILKNAEVGIKDDKAEMTGLVAYLVALEKQECAAIDVTPQKEELDLERREVCREIVEAEYVVKKAPVENDLPKL